MEQQHGDCDLIFPHQGENDRHAFIFYCLPGDPYLKELSFCCGQGYLGAVNKQSGDGLNVENQLELICQFCQNPHLKHLRVDLEGLFGLRPYEMSKDFVDYAPMIWTTFMRELRGSASLEYIEFVGVPNFDVVLTPKHKWTLKFGKTVTRSMVEMLSTNSSLLGLKVEIKYVKRVDIEPFIEVISTSNTLQVLYLNLHLILPLTLDDEDFVIQPLKLLLASLTSDGTGYQSNTRLRALFMNFIPYHPNPITSIYSSLEPLVEAFINMLETNKTLTTIQVPDFVCSAREIVMVLQVLEVNQSISNIILGSRKTTQQRPYFKETEEYLDQARYEEFSREEVFSQLLKLIKFRIDHGNGLSRVDVQRTGLEDPKFDVYIQGALKKKYCSDGSHGEYFVRPISCKVFLCGFPEAGKTTLRKKMKYILHEKSKKIHLLYSLSKRVEIPSKRVSKRTIGVEVVTTHAGAVELSLWDMGGQDEYHAFHDLVVPNLSDNGSASLFILVCSMATIKDGAKCTNAKSAKAIEMELQYWLRFLSSNMRISRNLKIHVLVVFTHVDVLPKSMNVRRHVEDLLASVKQKFGDSFHFSSMEYFVNNNSTQMVEPLVESVAKEVEDVLTKVPNIFAACLEMRDEIAQWRGDHPYETIIKWRDFVHLCSKLPLFEKVVAILDSDLAQGFCKTIASSLNEGGYIMYFEDLDVIVVDPNWFGTRIIGPIFSIDHKCLDPHTMEPVINEKGYMERDTLVSMLQNSFKDKNLGVIKKGANMTQHMDVDDLICVMKEMNVCFEEHCAPNMEKQKKSIFIPATLRDEGGLAHQGRRKLNWNVIGSSSSRPITYIGRCLQCEDLERTFLTPGFFPRLQVVLERKFGSNSTFRLEKNLVAITEDGMQILVEHSGDLPSGNFVNGFIDIMVQSLKTFAKTLQFVKEEVIKPIQRLCASPTFGCQGVILSQSILRPKCIEDLWLCHDRRDQAIKERVLIENVLSKEDFEGYIRHWPDHHGDEARTLLGDVVWNEEIVNKRIRSMVELTIVLMEEQDHDLASIKVEETKPQEKLQFTSLEGLYKKLTEDMGRGGDSIVERVNKHTEETIRGMQHEVLEEVSKSVNRLIDHSMQVLQRQVPCYVYVTTKDLGTSEWLISSLVPGLKAVQLHLMCEHKANIHTVDDQIGVALHLESKTLQGLRPYVIWGLRIITLLMKVSANVGAGLSSMVPDLERSLMKGVASVIPNISPDLFGQAGTPNEQVNLMKLKNYFNDSEKKIAEQWLVNFLVGRDLQKDFGLQRVRYLDRSNDLAWVCQKHIDEGRKARVLELCPILGGPMRPT